VWQAEVDWAAGCAVRAGAASLRRRLEAAGLDVEALVAQARASCGAL
jgi:hypothetical protein